MTDARIPLLLDADAVAQALERHPDFRVLRRLTPIERRRAGGLRDGEMSGAAIDVETTGLDHRRHVIIEFAVRRFRLDADRRIVETGVARSWLEEPDEPIPPAVSRITGLADADVAGRTIPEGEATGVLRDVDFIVAHNARFDRPFVEKRLPWAAGRPWVCSLSDLDWAALGFEGRTLSALLARMGRFYDAHRAREDVDALLHLLDYVFEDGSTAAGRLLDNAVRPTWEIDAEGAPFSARDVLKERGYRWSADRRAWTTSVGDDRVEQELQWAGVMLYGGRRRPSVRKVDWTQRFAAR